MMFGAVNPSAVTGGISELPTEQERAELDTNPPGYDAAIPRVFEPDGQNDGAPPVSPIGSPDGPSAQGSAVKRRRSALGFLSALKGGSSKSVRSSAAPLPESSGRHGSTVSLQGVKRRDSESSSGGKGKTTVGARSTITRPVDAGDGTKGLIHERPLKPMLVLFCQLRQSGVQGVATPSTGGIPSTGLFIATVDIDGSVVTNPRLCGCALAGDQCPCGILNRGEWSPGGKGPGNGGSSGGGGRSLSVRMYRGLDVALTALGRQGTTSTDALGGLAALTIGVGNGNSGQPLRGVERVTLEFPSPSTRRDCVGLARPCACKDLDIEINLWECVDKQRHEGLVGKVRNMYRRQMREWERVEEGRKDVLDDLEEYEMA